MDAQSFVILRSVLLVFMAVLILALVLVLIYARRRKKRRANEITVRQKSGGRNRAYLIYKLFQSLPVLKQQYARVRTTVEIIYPADAHSINKETSAILTRGMLGAIAGSVITLILAQGDIFFILAGFVVTYIILKSIIHGRLNKMHQKILIQFGEFLSKLRHHYHDTGIIESALQNSLDDIPYEIRLHIQKIYDIITSPDMNYELDQYVGTEPNKYVLMFLSLCASIKEFGDKKLADGTSLFLTDVNYLKEEVNNEIIGNRRNMTRFRSIPAITIAPLIAVKPLEIWARKYFDGISSFYDGIYGVVAMIVIFIVCVGCHSLVISLRDGANDIEKEESVWSKAADIPPVRWLLNKIINRYYTKYMRYNDALKGIGDHTGAKAFLLKQLVCAFATFLATLIIVFGAIVTSRYQKIQDFTDSFAESVVPSEEYRDNMRYVAAEYAKANKDLESEEIDKEALVVEISKHTDIKNKTFAEQIADAIVIRIEKYHNTFFKWFEILIAVGAGVVAFYVPVLYLRFRKQIIDMRKEEEVMRFQSIMLILMHINGTTLDVILEWMERFSYCFKESITACRVNVAGGSQQALEEMKLTERFGPFQDFVDNLISIDRVGVEKAFDEIQTDREYYMKKRDEDREDHINLKSSRARLIMFIPLFATLILYSIVPMVLYVYNMFQELQGALSM